MSKDFELHTIAIAERVMELSSLDTIKFDFVAATILDEFTDMSKDAIRDWIGHRQQMYIQQRKELLREGRSNV